MDKRGKFITIEGVEGSGKTTQAALLAEYLYKRGMQVIGTREPGGTGVGERIREILLSPAHSDLTYLSEINRPGMQLALFPHSTLTPITELLLFLAARAQLVRDVIRPALDSGMWVVSDRFSDATLAYQGHGRGIPVKAIQQVNDLATGGLKPDITVLLDMDVDLGIRRTLSAKREFANSDSIETVDRMENEHKEFHRRVRKGYLQLAEQQPDRIKVIPVTGSIEDVHRTIVSLVEPFLVKAT